MAFPFGIWGMGDKAGARMAFKDAWPAARAKYGDQVEVSLGHHKASRAAAVLDAVRTGMIEQRAARLLLPQLTDAEFAGMQRSLPSQTGAFAADPSRQRLRAGGQLVHRAGVWPPSGGRQISWPIISGPFEPAGCLNRAGRGTVSDNGQEHSGQGGRLVRFLTGNVAG